MTTRLVSIDIEDGTKEEAALVLKAFRPLFPGAWFEFQLLAHRDRVFVDGVEMRKYLPTLREAINSGNQ